MFKKEKGAVPLKEKVMSVLSFLNKKKHDIFTFLIGLAFIGLCCFAVIRLGSWVYRLFVPTDIYTDPSYENTLRGENVYEPMYMEEGFEEGTPEFFERYLENFIRQDIPFFEDPTQIDDKYLVSFGLWQAISLNGSQNIYQTDEKGNFRVPARDVETFAQYSLDYASKLKHSTVDICGKFKYSKLSKLYTIPSAGGESYLVPHVNEVTKGENDTYIITVDCYNSTMSGGDPTNDPQNFVRRVEIVMQDYGNTWVSETGVKMTHFKILSMQPVKETTVETEPSQSTQDAAQTPEQ